MPGKARITTAGTHPKGRAQLPVCAFYFRTRQFWRSAVGSLFPAEFGRQALRLGRYRVSEPRRSRQSDEGLGLSELIPAGALRSWRASLKAVHPFPHRSEGFLKNTITQTQHTVCPATPVRRLNPPACRGVAEQGANFGRETHGPWGLPARVYHYTAQPDRLLGWACVSGTPRLSYNMLRHLAGEMPALHRFHGPDSSVWSHTPLVGCCGR